MHDLIRIRGQNVIVHVHFLNYEFRASGPVLYMCTIHMYIAIFY